MGQPKSLLSDARGPWLVRAVTTLRDGGCDDIVVVLGAEADRARQLVPAHGARVVEAHDWSVGMGASLRAGLAAAGDSEAALIHLVDLPDVGPDVAARVLEHVAPDALARAVYDGLPGHPVLLGREHWVGVTTGAVGDRGARAYLDGRIVTEVECGDLATGRDVDEPPMLSPDA